MRISDRHACLKHFSLHLKCRGLPVMRVWACSWKYCYMKCLSEIKRFILMLALLLLSPAAPAQDTGGIPPREIAVYVRDLHTGAVLASHQADVSFNPASTMKLVTAFAALRALGPDFRWQTEFKSAVLPEGGTLPGDIYWVGSGDPVMDQDDLIAVQQQLRNRGILRIGGGLVLDRRVWSDPGVVRGFEEDKTEAFVTPPDPHMLAYKVVWLKPERNAGGLPFVNTNPPLPDVAQDNRVQFVPSPYCASLARYLSAGYENGVLRMSGTVPEGCIGREMFVNMLDTQDFAAKSFVNQWRAAGGAIASGFRTGGAPASSVTLARHHSPPLAQVLKDMNKMSNNIIARTLFLTMGEKKAVQGRHNAEAAVRRELAAAGLDDEALVLENGSGLSRRERLTARFLGDMLAKAYSSGFRQAFVESLPVSAVDGTLKDRFKSHRGELYLKTGTLKNVRALAGYYLPLGGQGNPLVLVVMVNSPKSDYYVKNIDNLILGFLPPKAAAASAAF